MGWLFTQGASRKDIIERLTKNETGYPQTLKHCTRGNILWSVVENPNGERFIRCDKLQRGNGGWGYKDMAESMHPFYYTCPLGYLDMVPVACEDWREKVREYHAKQLRKYEVGQVVELINSTIPRATITSSRPLCGEYRGTTYRIPKKMIV